MTPPPCGTPGWLGAPGRPLLLDAAMGTALVSRGLPADALPERWLVERPEEIARVHASHAAAGAELILTCTFNLARPAAAEWTADASALDALCAAAVRLARSASRAARVAGDLGPTGLVRPGAGVADPAALRARYARAARALAGAGAELLWLESQWDLGEARLALSAAAETGLPVVLTFVLIGDAERLRAPDGTPAEALLAAAAEGGAAATGVNCVTPGPGLAALAAWARTELQTPFVAKPSAGLPGRVLAPAALAAALRPAVEAGLAIAGGCCGATADHLRAIAALLRPAR